MTSSYSSNPADITCLDSVRLVSQRRDAELLTVDAELLERHLLECPRCAVARRQFQALFDTLDGLLARAADDGRKP